LDEKDEEYEQKLSRQESCYHKKKQAHAAKVEKMLSDKDADIEKKLCLKVAEMVLKEHELMALIHQMKLMCERKVAETE